MTGKVYETILELTFSFENALGIKIKSFFFHFNRNAVSNLLARPYAVVFTDMNGEKKRLTLEPIMKTLGFVPIYQLKKLPPTEYNIINLKDQLIPVSATDPNIELLKSMNNESFEYESSLGMNAIDEEVTEMVIDTLCEYEIPFDENKTGIVIYAGAESSYKIIVPKTSRNITDTGYCLAPAPHDFIETKSLGRFTYFGGKEVPSPAEYHLALIRPCPGCEKNIICDWEAFDGIPCPYCGKVVEA